MVVEVARDSQVDLALGVTLQESVAVTAATPRVDLRSTEVNFNFSKALIDQLPLQRTYAGLFQLIPGVAENNSFAPNGGGSRQDNTYLLDGVNITNPGFGYLSTEVNEFDIAGVLGQARRHHRGVRARLGLRHERRHPQRLELAVRRRPARGDPERLDQGQRQADPQHDQPAGAVVRARRPDPARPSLLLRIGAGDR